ncbi:MAG: site-specific integrase [Vulcanimicrobiota bacterium]
MLCSVFPKAHTRYESLPLLGGIWKSFCEWLHKQGYPTDAIRRRVQAGPLIEDRLQRQDVHSLFELTATELRSLATTPTCWTEQLACSLVRSLIDYLEERNELRSTPVTPIEKLVDRYKRHLESMRGLALSTAGRHGDRVTELLKYLDYDTNPQRLCELKIGDVDRYIVQTGRQLGRASMQKVTAILRSFLRFMAAEGGAPPGLDAQIDSPRCYRGERLPRALPWNTVRALIGAIDRGTIKGRRDYAMILMLATYGLRVSEIAALKLDDISWRSRQILVPRPKVGTPLLLPLTDDVATALLDYFIHGRGTSDHRQIFLRVRIPPGPINASAVCDAFDLWAARAGIRLPKGYGGAHCLRHSLAVHLLRQGTSVKAIGDILGHKNVESTSTYLRLQVEDLRDVALPVPQTVGKEVQQ